MLSLLQWLISIVALLVIMITMLLRAADLKDRGFQWDVRRVGLVLAGVSPLGFYISHWFHTTFYLGLAMVFVTTPQGIPWTKWVWKGTHS